MQLLGAAVPEELSGCEQLRCIAVQPDPRFLWQFVAAEADVQWLQPTDIPILSYDIPQLRNKSLRVTHSAPCLQFFLDWHAAGHAGCGALMGNATLLSSLKVSLLQAPTGRLFLHQDHRCKRALLCPATASSSSQEVSILWQLLCRTSTLT